MGKGVGAVIPLRFKEEKARYKEGSYPQRFLQHYDKAENEDGDQYFIFKIHTDFLLSNYEDFLTKFYKLIGVNYLDYTAFWYYADGTRRKEYGTSIEQDAGKITDMKSFYDIYDREKRNGGTPFVSYSSYEVSCSDCSPSVSWVFYSGTYKAYFEDYRTFDHLNNLVAPALDNPLAEVCQFAEIG